MKKSYIVTARAGEWIAGQRRPESGRIELTDRQAAYELALGTIIPAPAKSSQGPGDRKRRRKAAQ